MYDGKDMIMSFGIGFMLSVLIIVTVFHIMDLKPVEAPLQKKCEEFDSTLKSYDLTEFTCNNGLIFSRKSIDKE